jgi:hypothetical protein
MVGTGNGGALLTLRTLNRGRKYVPVLGRKFRPESLFTCSSLYEALPAYRKDPFLGADGRPLEVDLFDPRSWQRYGWSIYGRATQKRLARTRREDLFGDPAVRAAFLQDALDRARRLHSLLRQDVQDFGGTRYYSVQNATETTADRAVLIEHDGVWKTLFSTDGKIARDPNLRARTTTRGDRHAPVASQNWLSPQEQSALARRPGHVTSRHRQIIADPAAHRWILEFLLD